MTYKLFIYYRIQKVDILLGLACAKQLMTEVRQQGLGQGQLFQRDEADKPYFTLMEVIEPTDQHAKPVDQFTLEIEALAAGCFSSFASMPSRHLEIFNPIFQTV